MGILKFLNIKGILLFICIVTTLFIVFCISSKYQVIFPVGDTVITGKSIEASSSSFEIIYDYLKQKDSNDLPLSDGDFQNLKNMLSTEEDSLANLFKENSTNIFRSSEKLDVFLRLYYTYLEENQNKGWIDLRTREYFDLLDKIEMVDEIDIEETIKMIDSGEFDYKATEDTKYLIYGLIGNKKGYLEKMPIYDALSVLTKLNDAALDYSSLEPLFNTLRSDYNGV